MYILQWPELGSLTYAELFVRSNSVRKTKGGAKEISLGVPFLSHVKEWVNYLMSYALNKYGLGGAQQSSFKYHQPL